jgi:hypothetical protein
LFGLTSRRAKLVRFDGAKLKRRGDEEDDDFEEMEVDERRGAEMGEVGKDEKERSGVMRRDTPVVEGL